MIVLNATGSGTIDSVWVEVTNFMATTSILPWYIDWQDSTGGL